MIDRAAVTILVFGISGVGKTTLLESALQRFPAAHVWRASDIIGIARHEPDPEKLRTLPLDEIRLNQELLVRGFEARRREFAESLVLLDAHSVLDTEAGLIDIPVEVVSAFIPSGIIHVSDQIEQIQARRLADSARARPQRSLIELREYQERSMAACERFKSALEIPLIYVRAGEAGAFVAAIARIARP